MHGPTDISPVGMAAAMHLGLSIHNFGIQEYMKHSAQTDSVFQQSFTWTDGYLHPGDQPGLGVTLDVDEAGKYPYEQAYLPSTDSPTERSTTGDRQHPARLRDGRVGGGQVHRRRRPRRRARGAVRRRRRPALRGQPAKMASGIPLTDEDRWPWLDAVGARLHERSVDGPGHGVQCAATRLPRSHPRRRARRRVRAPRRLT